MLQFLHTTVQVEQTQVLLDCSAMFQLGLIHVLMGPNGSGKSSFAHTLVGLPLYEITSGSILYQGQDIRSYSMAQRSLELGFFITHQHVVAIPGLEVFRYLHELLCLHTRQRLTVDQALETIRPYLKMVDLPESVLYRSLYESFSGGEKKRLEIVQLLLIKPKLVILDEVDSGLDVDGLIKIAQALSWYKEQNPDVTFIIITHYAKLMQYLLADRVHIMINKKIVQSSDASLLDQIALHGFESYV